VAFRAFAFTLIIITLCGIMPGYAGASRGCMKAWTTYEAESGSTNGTILTWDGNRGTAASESSSRSCVKLSSPGQYVTVTTHCIASNTILVRYSIPKGTSGTVGLYVNGVKLMDLSLTSRFIYKNNGFHNNPDGSDGSVCDYFDEMRYVLTRPIPAGATVTLQKDAKSTLSFYLIDLVDLEWAPAALTQPKNSISIADHGGVPGGEIDNYGALASSIAAAQSQNKVLWIPPGVWNIGRRVNVTSKITIRGAGMWYSKLNFTTQHDSGFWLAGVPNCRFYDFSMEGQEIDRGDGSKPAFGGACTSGGVLQNIWIDHFVNGFWMGLGNKTYDNGFRIIGCRIRNTVADGVNCCGGTFGTLIRNCDVRGSGDDAFAVWPADDHGVGQASHDNTIENCTAECVWNANGFALYGGYNNKIISCSASDIATYNGINISTVFPGFGFSGANTVDGVTLIRCGGLCYDDNQQYGGIWFVTSLAPISGVTIRNIDIIDPIHAGIKIQNDLSGSTGNTFTNIAITGAGGYGVWILGSGSGKAIFAHVVNTKSASLGLCDEDKQFTISRETSNSGW